MLAYEGRQQNGAEVQQGCMAQELLPEAPADEPAADGQPDRCARAAALHAAVLTGPAAAPLGQQLELLLHLLALPPAVQVARTGSSIAAEALLPSGSAAAAYACAVLQQSGV
jgi:hypothetical protein